MKINHTYKIKFKPINHFKYEMYDEEIGVANYKPSVDTQLPSCINILNNDLSSRQCILSMNRGTEFMSCLLSIQFQIYNHKLYVTINLRSQAQQYIQKDSNLFKHITTQLLNGLDYEIQDVDMTVNVGNFHVRCIYK